MARGGLLAELCLGPRASSGAHAGRRCGGIIPLGVSGRKAGQDMRDIPIFQAVHYYFELPI